MRNFVVKSPNKIKISLITALFAAIIAIAFYYGQRAENSGHGELIADKTVSKTNAEKRVEELRNVLSSDVAGNKNSLDVENVNMHTSETGMVNPFQHIPMTRRGLNLEDDPFLPRSRAEQDWLDRHGYPNALQYSEYQAASDQQLQQAADAGDELAKTYLNSRKLLQGDKDAEITMLREGALGNSFALELVSSAIAHDDPVEGYALSRVVDMSGNFAIAQARDLFFPGASSLTIAQRTEAENRARAYLQLFKEYRRETEGPGATFFDPRPTDDG